PIATKGHVVTVYVAQGTYTESVVLAPEVSLRGDCTEPDWNCGAKAGSIILGVAEAAMNAGHSITSSTTVADFAMVGPDKPLTSNSIGLDVDGGTPVVESCVIAGGATVTPGKLSMGVRIDAAVDVPGSLNITDSIIGAGSGPTGSIGVALLSSHLKLKLE